METRIANPLHLTSLTILSPTNSPLYVHSFTGPEDELRHYHLSHAAVDVIEERIVMTSTPTKPAESYLGLLFCMEDMAFYGFQTTTKLRMVLSIALVDAMIKDADIVAIFRSVHNLLLTITTNPFLSLSPSFHGKPAPGHIENQAENQIPVEGKDEVRNGSVYSNGKSISNSKMFASGPDDIKTEWLKGSVRFTRGINRIGEMLNGRA
ncbi:uncharacterized protein I303_103803 [Kwoniella dejecticola CBS 10117]|uniref:Sedlin n=1 Tax=Kwoniella dejecticola CBS 10117 TaxID=1296121 RepID=A0A1A6A7R8_9TREE|nr:uncharacterized protein I303_03822 [Kwoniella dejecticola CBS 10117]OBR86103.1 hypothetical protein I303_03822 [Kwoniella dejecticola CBS 10117]